MIWQKFDPASLALVIFDLDGTLAESKQPLDKEMGQLLNSLLKEKSVAVMSGASFPQFENQFLGHLTEGEPNLNNLYLLPTSGARLYNFKNDAWSPVYFEELSIFDKDKIMKAFSQAMSQAEIPLESNPYGPIFEDRGSQITFSAMGQEAPLAVKSQWDPEQKKRQKIAGFLRELLPEFSVKIGGSSSIDITKKGIDKAFGLRKLTDFLKVSLDQVIYVGDALYPGGNDEPLLSCGVLCQSVDNVSETKDLIKKLLAPT